MKSTFKTYLLLLIIILGVIIYINFFPSKAINHSKHSTSAIENKSLKSKTVISSQKNREETVQKEAILEKKTQSEIIAERNEWMIKHGFNYRFDPHGGHEIVRAPISDYETYSLQDLKQMSKNDPKASMYLGQTLLSENKPIEARPYLYNAAMHGYARSLIDMSNSYIHEAKYVLDNNKALESEELYIKAFAWGHLMNLRFYPDNDEPAMESYVSIPEKKLKAIKQKARVEAKKIYSKLQQERALLGLDEFDNYVPSNFLNSQ